MECLIHDDAIVVSGDLAVTAADYGQVSAKISDRLSAVAAAVTASGGIIGHIKASASATQVEMFSITDADGAVSTKASPEQSISIHAVAIVFNMDPEAAQSAVRSALEQI